MANKELSSVGDRGRAVAETLDRLELDRIAARRRFEGVRDAHDSAPATTSERSAISERSA